MLIAYTLSSIVAPYTIVTKLNARNRTRVRERFFNCISTKGSIDNNPNPILPQDSFLFSSSRSPLFFNYISIFTFSKQHNGCHWALSYNGWWGFILSFSLTLALTSLKTTFSFSFFAHQGHEFIGNGRQAFVYCSRFEI